MKTLIGMTDFIINAKTEMANLPDESFDITLTRRGKLIESIFNYARFLKQSLTLGQFIPCDENNVPLEQIEIKPERDDYWSDNDTVFSGELFAHNVKMYNTYQAAKSRVLFEGFKIQYFNPDTTAKGSFQILSEDDKIQICIYKSQPDYFIWNNGGKSEHPTIEYLTKYNLTLFETAIKQIYG